MNHNLSDDRLSFVMDAFFGWMSAMAWQVAILVLLLFMFDRVCRGRTSARFRYAMWLLVPIRLVLPPTLALATSWAWWLPDTGLMIAMQSELPQREATSDEASLTILSHSTMDLALVSQPASWPTKSLPPRQARFPASTQFDSPVGSKDAFSPMTLAIESPEPRQNVEAHRPTRFIEATTEEGATGTQASSRWSWVRNLTVFAWMTVMSILLARFMWGMVCVQGMCRRALPASTGLKGLVSDCEGTVGLAWKVPIGYSLDVSTPTLVGIVRPMILLPQGLEKVLKAAELRSVLIHELEHIKRRDPIVNALTTVLTCVYWFHPAIWVAGWKLRQLRELACDESTVSTLSGVRKDYASGLIKVAEMISQSPPQPAMGFIERKSEMKNRIRNILDKRMPIGRRLSFAGVLAVVALSLVLLPTGERPANVVAEDKAAHPDSIAESGKTESQVIPSLDANVSQPEAASSTVGLSTDASLRQQEQQKSAAKSAEKIPFEVSVFDVAGKPIEGVSIHSNAVTYHMDDEGVKRSEVINENFLSDEEGIVHIQLPSPLQSVRFWPSREGLVPLFFSWEEGDVDNLPAKYSIVMQPGTTVGGIVVDPQGKPVVGAKVDVSRQGGGQKIDPQERTRFNPWLANGEAMAVTDDKGHWEIHNAPAGDDLTLNFQIEHPGFINDTRRKGMVEYDVTLAQLRAGAARFELTSGGEIIGKVTDANGKPVENALVVWGDRPYWTQGSQEVLTNVSGDYRIPPQPAGELRITVVAENWMPRDRVLNLSDGAETGVDFQLQEGKNLEIQFVDENGQPVKEVGVSIDQWHGSEALYNMRHPNVKPSKIPNSTGQSNVYRWTWAPDDLMRLRFSKVGYFGARTVDVVTRDEPIVMKMIKPFELLGEVVDAKTGKPISEYSIVPIVFASGSASERGLAQISRIQKFRESHFSKNDGFYELEGTETAFRFQAVGYRDFDTRRFKATDPSDPQVIRMEPVATRSIKILDADGKAPDHARAWVVKHDEMILIDSYADYKTSARGGSGVSADGVLQYGAPNLRHAVVVASETGYAERYLDVDETVESLQLQPWASVRGTVYQDGKPMKGVTVIARPIRQLGGDHPHVQDIFSVMTDHDGHFEFQKLPPVPIRVRPLLTVWEDYPITSACDVPLDLQPGQTAEVSLGQGTQAVGQVRLIGSGAEGIQYRYALTELLNIDRSIETPVHARQPVQYQTGESAAWQRRLKRGLDEDRDYESHFVRLQDDGTFFINGLQPGDYRFLIKMYEPPSGCLVEPVGYGYLEFSTQDFQIVDGRIDLGTIDINLQPFPKLGDPLPDFRYQDGDGKTHTISEFRGKRVMLDFWASWCQPCLKAFPDLKKIHQRTNSRDDVAMISISVDEDRAAAKTVALRHDLSWAVGYAGKSPNEGNSAKVLGISTVPTYLVIGEDGDLLYRGFSFKEAEQILTGK